MERTKRVLRKWLAAAVATMTVLTATAQGRAEQPVKPALSRQQLEGVWRDRIRSLLGRGMIPLIDFLSFLPRQNGDAVANRTMKVMDEQGVALMVLGGFWAAGSSKRYRWGYYIHEVANAHPRHFVLATNKGGNRDWWAQREHGHMNFIDQLERQVRGGDYPFISEVEFRHYMSNAQCRSGKTHRDVDIPLNGTAGHRLFRLAAETATPVSIHLELEDGPLAALQQMLAAYPGTKVIVAHFGQIRHPERQKKFTPGTVRFLLSRYANLYFDLSTGEPGRRYKCAGRPLDTVIWEDDGAGGQRDTLKAAYREILTRFSNRFVAGFDFGPENRQSATYLRRRIGNTRLILRDLPIEAKHNIAYRNGWKLLTGKHWE